MLYDVGGGEGVEGVSGSLGKVWELGNGNVQVPSSSETRPWYLRGLSM